MKIPKSHPRYKMLSTQERLVEGVKKGITSIQGLLAHGRGEAFDYLIGEKTNNFAKKSIEAAAALLLTAKHPVISVNGNVAALVPDEIVKLSVLIPAPIEINIFHSSKKRERLMKKELKRKGAKVLMPSRKHMLSDLNHNRRFVNKEGMHKADVVLVPLEDGDRCEALIKNGKKVITIDLNPLSRTSQTATITIVDNIIRCAGLLAQDVKRLKNKNKKTILEKYNNKTILKQAILKIRG